MVFIKLPATVYIIIPSLMLLLPFARAWYKIMIFANVFMYPRGIFANICMYPRGIFANVFMYSRGIFGFP